jgi:predicted nucleic acid-binding protein
MKPDVQIDRITHRFEIAVSNFGRSCIDMRANEKAFQAWYAACVIQEFGLSHVYREIHLGKSELFRLAPPNELTKNLQEGNELLADVSVSWFPDIDARHSSTREKKLRKAGAFLREFSLISELKVTGSTLKPTPPRHVFNDIVKLFVFSAAHKSFSETHNNTLPLRCYMVVLDNAKDKDGNFKKSYSRSKIDRLVYKAKNSWKDGVPKPCVILISPGQHTTRVSLLRDFKEWITLD